MQKGKIYEQFINKFLKGNIVSDYQDNYDIEGRNYIYEIKGTKLQEKGKSSLGRYKIFIENHNKFKQYAEKNNLKNVKFLGGIFGEKKMQWLAACDVLILPSLKEGAPVSVMESLAQNKPVIVTDVGGVRLMLENDREGIIIRQKSSLDIVRAVKKIINKPIKDVRQYANIYKWKKIVDDTVKDYLK